MSATFKCLLSGQTVTFEHQVDIDSMKGHPDYERVEEGVVKEETVVVTKKTVGRPSKQSGEVKVETVTSSEE